MNSVSEEQEDEEDEELKATKKSVFGEEEAREVVAHYTTIQAVRDGKATKKDFAGPLPLAVG